MTPAVLDSGVKYITNGLKLHIDAAQLRSYSGTGTSVTDVSGSSNPCTLTNGPTFNSGNGGYFILDGTNDYIITTTASLGLGANSSTVFTVSLWMYVVSINNNGNYNALVRLYDPAFPTNNEAGIRYNYLGAVQLYLSGFNVQAETASGIITTTGAWQNIVCAFDQNATPRARIFANGTKTDLTIGNSSSGIPSSGANATVGLIRGGGNNYPNIRVATFSVYNRSLTDTEVTQNYNALKSRFGL